MDKQETGLHKDIASIFDGVSVPKKEQDKKSSEVPAAEQNIKVPVGTLTPSHLTSKTKAPAKQKPESVEEPKEADVEPRDNDVESQEPAPKPFLKPQKPNIQPAKAVQPKQPKVDVPVKITSKPPVWKKSFQQIQAKLFAPKVGVDPARQKIMMVLIPVLFVVLVVVLTQVMKGPARKINKTTEFAGSPAAPSTAGAEVDWQTPEPYPETLRDPMQFGSVGFVQPESNSRIIVKGILYSEDKPSAIIGDEIIYQGDEIMGATVVKITKDSVEFEKDNEKWTQKVQR